MTKPYEKRLEAIHELLVNPSQELVQEGYSLLFRLWLENADNPIFIRRLDSYCFGTSRRYDGA